MSVDGISAKLLVENPYVKNLVHRKAYQLARLKEFANDSVEDIAQDLFLHLVEQASKYNPNKAKVETFAARVTERQAVSLIRHRKARCRGCGRRLLSLNTPITDGNGKEVDRASLMTRDDGLRRLGRHECTAEDASDRTHDTERFLSQLPSEFRDLLVRCLASSIAQVARDMGVSRTTIHTHLNEVLKFIEENRLAEFLRDR